MELWVYKDELFKYSEDAMEYIAENCEYIGEEGLMREFESEVYSINEFSEFLKHCDSEALTLDERIDLCHEFGINYNEEMSQLLEDKRDWERNNE